MRRGEGKGEKLKVKVGKEMDERGEWYWVGANEGKKFRRGKYEEY